ncbi:MAG: type I glutamate--ammonia ligase [Myxococcota bacterium]|nr:type I glutamate--ammonia ligase [Myxococcota bacterium]
MIKSDKKALLDQLKADQVRFIRLQFTDIMGANKNVEVPESEFEKALDGQILFDGSAVEGFARIEESDMLLKPDSATYAVYPWQEGGGRVARLICDIHNPDGSPFEGCPRLTLKRVCKQAADLGYGLQIEPEPEFFLFNRTAAGEPTIQSNDQGGYFDLTPTNQGEEARRAIVNALEAMGFGIQAGHHEVAPAQHEIDFKNQHALGTADDIATFRFVVRKIACDAGLHATFMPKPVFGLNGCGMHLHQSLFKDNENLFFDPQSEDGLSCMAKGYIAGLLQHAKAYCAVTNPLVNSYKRLVPDYEAPTHVAWSERNRSPLVRVPAPRGDRTGVELRLPDPTCNPYLAIAVIFAAGLEGIQHEADPGPPVNRNIFSISHREQRRLKIDPLPGNLGEAIDAMIKDRFVRDVLGDHIFKHFVQAKRTEWREYMAEVHAWEINRYLATY